MLATGSNIVTRWGKGNYTFPRSLCEMSQKAATALRECAEDEDRHYVFDLEGCGHRRYSEVVYISPAGHKRRKGVTYVSPSGAIIAKMMMASPLSTLYPEDFDKRTCDCLTAVDHLGHAFLFEAVETMHGFEDVTREQRRELQWHQANLFKPLKEFIDAERAMNAYASVFESLAL